MPQSAAFIRIRQQVLQVVAAIPAARVCTYQSIGEHLDVMARHVAYILSQLDDENKRTYPWHRVVSGDGSLGVLKRGPDGMSQAEWLAREGVEVVDNALSPALAQYFIPARLLKHGLPQQVRPLNALSPQPQTLRTRRHARRTPA